MRVNGVTVPKVWAKPRIRLRHAKLAAEFKRDAAGVNRYVRSIWFVDWPRLGKAPFRIVIGIDRNTPADRNLRERHA